MSQFWIGCVIGAFFGGLLGDTLLRMALKLVN